MGGASKRPQMEEGKKNDSAASEYPFRTESSSFPIK